MALEVAARSPRCRLDSHGRRWPKFAEQQLKIEEKQRVLGIIPNFYVSYVPHAAPLDCETEIQAGHEDGGGSIYVPGGGRDCGSGAGAKSLLRIWQGAEGYAKRFGANYADTVTGTFIGGAIFRRC